MKKVYIETPVGEIIDKLTILEIKKKKIKQKNSQIHINKEYVALKKTLKKNVIFSKELNNLWKELLIVNQEIWDMENYKREAQKHLEKITSVALKVYKNNDKRAKIKYKINRLTKSNTLEIKNYSKY